MGDDKTVAASAVVRSDKWTYEKPELTLACSSPSWEDNSTLKWNFTNDADIVDHYMIRFYAEDQKTFVDEVKIDGSKYSMESSAFNCLWEHGSGNYCFTVQAYSSNVETAVSSPESGPSNVFYFESGIQATPTDLKIGCYYDTRWDSDQQKTVEYLVECPGYICFKKGDTSQDRYVICLYKKSEDGEYKVVGVVTESFGASECEYYSTDSFFKSFDGSGTYYFTVQASTLDNDKYKKSKIATSDVWEYIAPGAQLPAPDALAWTWAAQYSDSTDKVLTATWSAPSGDENIAGYDLEFYFAKTKGGTSTRINSTSSYQNETKVVFPTYLLTTYGAGYYSFRVRAYSNNIGEVSHSEWSALSNAYDATSASAKVNNQLESIASGLTEGATVSDIQSAIKKEMTQEELATALAVDKDNSGATKLLAALEEAVGVKAGTTVSDSLSETFDKDKVSVVGAALNAQAGETVTLNISTASETREVPKEYGNNENAILFSMQLAGAKENTEEHQELTVPVKITLPIPSNIKPGFLVLLHFKGDENYEQIQPYIYCKDDQWYATFVVSSFSDFALVEEAQAIKTDDGVSVTLRIADESTAQAFCAVYDKDGKQIGMKAADASKNGTQNVTVSCDPDQAYQVKVFLLGQGSEPLHQAAEMTIQGSNTGE